MAFSAGSESLWATGQAWLPALAVSNCSITYGPDAAERLRRALTRNSAKDKAGIKAYRDLMQSLGVYSDLSAAEGIVKVTARIGMACFFRVTGDGKVERLQVDLSRLNSQFVSNNFKGARLVVTVEFTGDILKESGISAFSRLDDETRRLSVAALAKQQNAAEATLRRCLNNPSYRVFL